jgi:long-chain-fatty-acid--CoA ligase ACSBG
VQAARIEQQRPGHSCTLIYTSGTTGNPKAVMMTHDNLTWTARSLFSIMPHSTFGKTEEHIVSYLPLSHIAAQMIDIHLPIAIAAMYPGTGAVSCCVRSLAHSLALTRAHRIAGNATVHFARPDALKGTLGDTLKACRYVVCDRHLVRARSQSRA